MDLIEHFRTISRRRWPILAASAAVALAVLAWRSAEAPVFRATVLVSVTSGRALSGETVTEQDTVFIARNYAELARTEPVLADAAGRSGLGLTPAAARALVSARAASDIGFVTIAALGPAPAAASALAQATAEALIAAVAGQQQAALESALRPVEEEIQGLEERLLSLPPGSGAQATLEARYDALVRSATERRLAPTDRLVVVAAARAAPDPVAPRPFRDALLALVVALVVNAEAAVVIEALRDRFSPDDPDEGVAAATGLPVLSRVPASGDRQVVEAFRTLRTNLMFMEAGQQIRTVAVVSAEPNAGKTFTSLHLAASMAGLEAPVVIVDGDLRRPGVHGQLGVGPGPGLGDVIAGARPDQVVHPVPGSGHLHLVPGGTPVADPAAVLGTRQFADLLAYLQWAAIVVVDTPACGIFADGLAIASQCDATVVVIDPRRSRRRAVQRVLTQLRQVGANPIGVVLNRVERPGRSSYYYGYYREPTGAAAGAHPGARRAR
jgi:capsular exopolysaccharide synthesis family protein